MIKLTKQAVAREQLEAAVREFLAGRVVAAHVLASSAFAVITAAALHRGVTTYRVQIGEMLPRDLARQVYKTLDLHYNFMKHANDDPEGVVEEFHLEHTELVLAAAIIDYQRVYNDTSGALLVFRMWWSAKHPDWFSERVRSALPGIQASITDLGGPVQFIATLDNDPEFARKFQDQIAATLLT